ncbi:MAG: TRAP transporter TatT component family protein [Verrucomicrobiia bacterium]
MKPRVLILVAALALNSGCAIKRFAVNQVGNALAGGGATISSDDDPDLIRDAAPFSLKLMESLLAESPQHRGLLLATASGFTQYGYAFVQQDADELEGKDLAAATALRVRARKLYLRARDYGLRGLEVNHRGFSQSLRTDPKKAVRVATKRDVPLLYWTAAAWGGAITVSKDKPDIVADLPKMEALIDRALELDEKFDYGAIHTFLINYELARPGAKADEAATRAKQHFERAMELSGRQLASPLVTYAEAVCVQKQQRAEFEQLLKQALVIDVDRKPEWRLTNLVMQRRAQWLLSREDELFAE